MRERVIGIIGADFHMGQLLAEAIMARDMTPVLIMAPLPDPVHEAPAYQCSFIMHEHGNAFYKAEQALAPFDLAMQEIPQMPLVPFCIRPEMDMPSAYELGLIRKGNKGSGWSVPGPKRERAARQKKRAQRQARRHCRR